MVGSNQYRSHSGTSHLPITVPDLLTQASTASTVRQRCGDVWGTSCRAWVYAPSWSHQNHPGDHRRLRHHPHPEQLLELVEPSLLTNDQLVHLLRNQRMRLSHLLKLCDSERCEDVLRALMTVWVQYDSNQCSVHPYYWSEHEWEQVLQRWPAHIRIHPLEGILLNWAAEQPGMLSAMWRSERWKPATERLIHYSVPSDVQDIALQRALEAPEITAQLNLPNCIEWTSDRVTTWARSVHPSAVSSAFDIKTNMQPNDADWDMLIQRCHYYYLAVGSIAAALARDDREDKLQKLWDSVPQWHVDQIDKYWLRPLQQLCKSLVAPIEAITKCTIATLCDSGSHRYVYPGHLFPWEHQQVTERSCAPQTLETLYEHPIASTRLDQYDRSKIVGLPWCPPSVLEREAIVPIPPANSLKKVWADNETETAVPWYKALSHPNCPLPALLQAIQSPNTQGWPNTASMLRQHPGIPQEYRTLIQIT